MQLDINQATTLTFAIPANKSKGNPTLVLQTSQANGYVTKFSKTASTYDYKAGIVTFDIPALSDNDAACEDGVRYMFYTWGAGYQDVIESGTVSWTGCDSDDGEGGGDGGGGDGGGGGGDGTSPYGAVTPGQTPSLPFVPTSDPCLPEQPTPLFPSVPSPCDDGSETPPATSPTSFSR